MPNKASPVSRINKLYLTGLDLIERDITRIGQSNMLNGEPLTASLSKSLRDYMKLLGELKAAHQALLDEKKAKADAAAKAASDAVLAEAASNG